MKTTMRWLALLSIWLGQPAWAYYSPSNGRWLNRDPIAEQGGRNLTGFLANDPVNYTDALGLRAEVPRRDLQKYRTCRRASLNARLVQGGVGPGDHRKDCCQVITVIIKLPLCTATGFDGKGLGGHTGIGIGSEYYDYGPDVEQKPRYLTGMPGFQWWDEPPTGLTPDDIGLDDILNMIPNIARAANGESLDVFKIEIAVSAEEAARVRGYWRDKYEDLGNYSLLGDQCTTTVMKSLDRAGVVSRPFLTYKPIGFLQHLKDARHTCGPNRGKPVRLQHINREQSPASCTTP